MMITRNLIKKIGSGILTFVVFSPSLILAQSPPASASIAFGSINNFDTVNDTGVVCHGFEIEIDDIHSRDITYTYDWNHYGVPKITEDNTDPLHPKVFVRYESARNANGTWAAYTAIPSGPINPTDGHQFTNPAVNFGGEHFGVGFYGAPTAVKYSWLKDDGIGNLVFAGAVNIATPTFTYVPPAPAVPAQVQAAIVPPPPPAPPVLEFGPASWVKETRTQTHNNNRVELRDLVTDDPNDPNDRNWKNNEPDEVEVEWQLLQTDYNSGNGGANGRMEGAPEGLPNGNEVITRRYDFFKYVGPIDAETGEAMADRVGPDGIHGVGIKTINGVEVDLSTIVVVGDFVGAQMAGFDAAGQIGLIDHLQDGEVNLPYVERTIVVGGTAPIVTTRTGDLPDGMTFDEVTGVLSGTPNVTGVFTFTIHSMDVAGGDVTTTYHLTILDPGIVQPPHVTVTTIASPPEGGTTSGSFEYLVGTLVTVSATENPGFAFVYWTDGGTIVNTSPIYDFTAEVNRELVAKFVQAHTVSGTVTLQECFNNLQPVTFEFRPVGGGDIFYRTQTLTETGIFSLPVPIGNYTLAIKGAKWLRVTQPVNASNGDVSGLTAVLKAGDANNDNVVDVFDLDPLIQAFNTLPEDGNWNSNADFNCDDSVDVFDLDLLIRNYNVQGDD